MVGQFKLNFVRRSNRHKTSFHVFYRRILLLPCLLRRMLGAWVLLRRTLCRSVQEWYVRFARKYSIRPVGFTQKPSRCEGQRSQVRTHMFYRRRPNQAGEL